MDRYVWAIILTFAAVFLANGILVWAALSNPASIVESYETETR